jgi:hypothetical protein
MRRLATLIGFVVPIAVAAQSQTVDEAPVFRLSVELVQVDAVVTDGKGSHVTTLGPEDFEVFQDGEPRAITAVVYVDADERWEPLGHPGVAEAIPARPRDARRTIALIVDDLRMSLDSLARTRTGLSRFVDEHLRSEDLVSLVTTSGDATPFTFRRAELRAAASRLRYSLFRSPSILDPLPPARSASMPHSASSRIFVSGRSPLAPLAVSRTWYMPSAHSQAARPWSWYPTDSCSSGQDSPTSKCATPCGGWSIGPTAQVS